MAEGAGAERERRLSRPIKPKVYYDFLPDNNAAAEAPGTARDRSTRDLYTARTAAQRAGACLVAPGWCWAQKQGNKSDPLARAQAAIGRRLKVYWKVRAPSVAH